METVRPTDSDELNQSESISDLPDSLQDKLEELNIFERFDPLMSGSLDLLKGIYEDFDNSSNYSANIENALSKAKYKILSYGGNVLENITEEESIDVDSSKATELQWTAFLKDSTSKFEEKPIVLSNLAYESVNTSSKKKSNKERLGNPLPDPNILFSPFKDSDRNIYTERNRIIEDGSNELKIRQFTSNKKQEEALSKSGLSENLNQNSQNGKEDTPIHLTRDVKKIFNISPLRLYDSKPPEDAGNENSNRSNGNNNHRDRNSFRKEPNEHAGKKYIHIVQNNNYYIDIRCNSQNAKPKESRQFHESNPYKKPNDKAKNLNQLKKYYYDKACSKSRSKDKLMKGKILRSSPENNSLVTVDKADRESFEKGSRLKTTKPKYFIDM